MRIIKSSGASLVTFYFIGVFWSQLTFNPYKWAMFCYPISQAIWIMAVGFFCLIVLFAFFYLEVFNEEVD